MKTARALGLFAFFSVFPCLIASEAPSRDFSISYASNRGELEITYQSKRLLLYSFATNQLKPYVKELYTLNGQDILRDSPPDHLHHHGLMYAIRVNGINFWEEVGEPGRDDPCESRLTNPIQATLFLLR